jgi:Arc/MetJ-type ribon-helix-helix transcriptional regulator
MNKYNEKKKKIHVNVFIEEQVWERVKEVASYGYMSEFVRDSIDEKLQRMEEKGEI